MANSVDPDQTAPIRAVCYGSMLYASILDSSVMLGNYLQETTSADDIFRCIFFLALNGLKRYVLKLTTQIQVYGSTHEISILVALSNNEGSGEPEHTHSLT